MLLLDCCFSGAAGQDLRGSITDELSQHQTAVGHHVFTSSTDTEVSREEVDGSAGEKLGAFTATLIQGLISGEADTDKDGAISLQELRTYVQNSLRRQKPQYWGHKTSGDPLIAVNHGRSDNLRITRVSEKLRAWVNDDKLDPVIFVQIVTALQQPQTEAEKRAREILLRLHETRSFTPEAVQLTWRQFVGRQTGEIPQPPPPEQHHPVVAPPEPEPKRPIHTGSRASTGATHDSAPNILRHRYLKAGAFAAGLIGITAVLLLKPGGTSISGPAETGGITALDTNGRDSAPSRSDTSKIGADSQRTPRVAPNPPG